MSNKFKQPIGKDPVQGEGDYEAARRFDKAEEAFVRAGRVDEAARRAKPVDSKEAAELERAEELGRKRGKSEKAQAGNNASRRQKPEPASKAKP